MIKLTASCGSYSETSLVGYLTVVDHCLSTSLVAPTSISVHVYYLRHANESITIPAFTLWGLPSDACGTIQYELDMQSGPEDPESAFAWDRDSRTLYMMTS